MGQSSAAEVTVDEVQSPPAADLTGWLLPVPSLPLSFLFTFYFGLLSLVHLQVDQVLSPTPVQPLSHD